MVMDDDFEVYIDFDSTLYDTVRFKTDLWRAIASRSQATVDELDADARSYDMYPTFGGYDYISHMTAHGLDAAQMWEVLDTLEHANYLYPDSAVFINTLWANGYNPRILSFGEQQFQTAKIAPTVAALESKASYSKRQRLNFDIILRPKGEHLAELQPGRHGALVDDKPDQYLSSGFTEVHLDRTQKLPKPIRRLDGYTVSDLMQAYQVIQKLHPGSIPLSD
jgi:hypothetical protein